MARYSVNNYTVEPLLSTPEEKFEAANNCGLYQSP